MYMDFHSALLKIQWAILPSSDFRSSGTGGCRSGVPARLNGKLPLPADHGNAEPWPTTAPGASRTGAACRGSSAHSPARLTPQHYTKAHFSRKRRRLDCVRRVGALHPPASPSHNTHGEPPSGGVTHRNLPPTSPITQRPWARGLSVAEGQLPAGSTGFGRPPLSRCAGGAKPGPFSTGRGTPGHRAPWRPWAPCLLWTTGLHLV